MPGDTLHLNTKAVSQNNFDAIVIGSGISGGWAAKELCEKGLKTLVIERGRNVDSKEFLESTKAPWERKHPGALTVAYKLNYPIQSKIYAFNEVSKKFFVNDLEHPYIQVKPYDWFRGYQVGGRSILWGRECYRWSDLDFEANAKEGLGIDWPIRYKDIAPWYDYVEQFVGISGSLENLPQLPDGKYLPPMQMNCVEKHAAQRIKELYGNDRRLIIGRCANLTKGLKDRGPCQFRNQCHEGCPYSGYFSSNSATLPAAIHTGNLTLRPNALVVELLYDKAKKRATGVRILDTETNKTEEYFSRIVFVNASTINTAFILLHSVSDAFPNGFGNSSGQVGHNLMDHHKGVGASGRIEGFTDDYYYGRRPAVTYIPRFRNINAHSKVSEFLRGYSHQFSAARGRAQEGKETIGAAFKETMTEPGNWNADINGFGETLPVFDNKVTLDKIKKDKYGLPMIAIEIELRENEKQMRKDMADSAAEMLDKIGAKNIVAYDSTAHPGQRVFSVHEMGTARMGKDAKNSVLNAHNQMHDVPNVFITDGSCMVSSACQEPSLTYMALTARACDFAVKELKKGNL